MTKSAGTQTSTVDDIWGDDYLGRSSDAEHLIQFLLARVGEYQKAQQPRSYVLNLDADWGQGKTFFLTRLQKQLLHDKYPVVYINAWEYDHAPDPLVPLLQALDAYYTASRCPGRR